MRSVSPVQIAIDPPASCSVIGIVGVVETESFEGTEVRLDGIEPTGVRWGRHQPDVVVSSEPLEVFVPVRGQVVLDEVKPNGGGITRPQPSPGGQEIPAGFAFVDGAGEYIAMTIVEGQQLLGSWSTVIGGPYALGMPGVGPARPGQGFEFHRTEFVEADNRSVRRSLLVEFQDPVFFDSN